MVIYSAEEAETRPDGGVQLPSFPVSGALDAVISTFQVF